MLPSVWVLLLVMPVLLLRIHLVGADFVETNCHPLRYCALVAMHAAAPFGYSRRIGYYGSPSGAQAANSSLPSHGTVHEAQHGSARVLTVVGESASGCASSRLGQASFNAYARPTGVP